MKTSTRQRGQGSKFKMYSDSVRKLYELESGIQCVCWNQYYALLANI